MATYKVLIKFKDLKDGGHIYEAGDIYPREGKKASQARLAELSGSENKGGRPLIEEIPEAPEEEVEPEEPKKKTKKKGK